MLTNWKALLAGALVAVALPIAAAAPASAAAQSNCITYVAGGIELTLCPPQ